MDSLRRAVALLAAALRAGSDEPGAVGQASTTAPAVRPEAETLPQEAVSRSWNVVVLNDPVNLMSYVTLVFRKVFGYSFEHAHRLMLEVHERGRAIVWTGELERAEGYVRQLQAHQLLAVLESTS